MYIDAYVSHVAGLQSFATPSSHLRAAGGSRHQGVHAEVGVAPAAKVADEPEHLLGDDFVESQLHLLVRNAPYGDCGSTLRSPNKIADSFVSWASNL